jgi:ACS family hexuronate transporter-like MFS transporter
MINLVDRQSLSVMAPIIREHLHLSPSQYGYITAAFQAGMMMGQVPAGAFLDAVGTRAGLAGILVLWSVISASHALALGLAALIFLRFLMGLAQCGNYTAGIKSVASLFPSASRSSAGGIFNAGAQLGSVIAPPLIVFIARASDWRLGFVVPAVLGLLWLGPWLKVFPKEVSRRTSNGAQAPKIRWRELIRNRKVAGLFLIRVCSGPLTTFYWFWLPEYLRSGRRMSFAMIGALAWMPYLFGATGNVAGGYLSDRLVKIGPSVDRARKVGFTLSFALSALSMMLPLAGNDFTALAIVSAVLFGNQWVAANYIATVGDVVPHEYAGRVNGLAGFGDSLSTLLGTLLTGIVVERFSYTPVFVAAGCLPLLAMVSVFFVLGRIEPGQSIRLKDRDQGSAARPALAR